MLIRQGTMTEVVTAELAIPEFTRKFGLAPLQQRLSGVKHLILIAHTDEQQVAAYKVGYQLSAKAFYSWVGAVLPAYRGSGVAQQLMHEQESWAKQQGYSWLSVKSQNSFPGMLRLLIRNGYAISGYEDRGDLLANKIHFSKRL